MGPLCLNWMNLSGVSIHGHSFCVRGCQIEWPRWSEAWNQYSDWGPHPHTTKQLKWPWRCRGIWKHSITFTILVSNKKTSTWLAWDSVLFRNTGDLHKRWRSDTITPSHMAGTNSGRHGLRWQIWLDRSCSDLPRQGNPVLWAVIIRRSTEVGQGVRHHNHIVRSHELGWQTSQTQCQTSKPGWWLAVDCPSHH